MENAPPRDAHCSTFDETAHIIYFAFVKTFASSQSANFDPLDVSFDAIKATSVPNGLFIAKD